jgi:quinol monooxygenase YgiN
MATIQYILIIHEVENYESWKKVFDQVASIQKAAGERSYQVLSHESDPNQVVHFSSWTSIAAAKQFFEFPELIQIRLEAGVKSHEFIYLNQLESGTF